MVRHGLSHASAALVSVLSAELLGRKLAEHLPAVNALMGEYMTPVLERAGLNVVSATAGSLMVVLLLGFGWGAAFWMMEDDR